MNNDRLLIENYLLILKSTVEVFVHGTLESSNNNIRNCLKNGLDSIMKNQANTYELMVKNGWYSVSNVSVSEIRSTIKKLK